MDRSPYFLGCPVWACAAWTGSVFRAAARRGDWLSQYSEMFTTVEGNSTFYATPSLDTARRWAQETAAGFRFALKFPQSISHHSELVRCTDELQAFLHVLEVLAEADRLGPSFLQLHARFGPDRLDILEQFLSALPTDFPYAVEVRHPAFFAGGDDELALDTMLTRQGVDRVLFDSRAIFAGPPNDAYERESQRRKPRVPLRRTVTGKRPLVRFVGRNQIEHSRTELDEWAPIVADWIHQGLEPYFFTHAPCDTFAPAMARMFHEALTGVIPQLPPLPPTYEQRVAAHPRQLELF